MAVTQRDRKAPFGDGGSPLADGGVVGGPLGPTEPFAGEARLGSSWLRRLLVLIDVVAIAAASLVVWFVRPLDAASTLGAAAAGLTAAGLAGVGWRIISMQRLYLARVASVRTVELSRLVGATIGLGVVHGVLDAAVHHVVRLDRAAVFAGCSGVLLILGRMGYRGWLKACRTGGRYCRPVVIVGTNDHARDLLGILRDHPELGFRPLGVVGDQDQAMLNDMGEQWLGPVDRARQLLQDGQVSGAVVAATALDPRLLNSVTRSLSEAGGHIYVSSGLRGLDHRRMRPVHLAYEPLYYLEPPGLSPVQLAVKRTMDIALAVVGLVIAVPILLAAALAIRWADGGPILFRQDRVGRGGTTFRIIKLRTMVRDAETSLDAIRERNLRQGPLFKADDDPRITRPGRVLRALSIDEIPQLVNVLRGDMSLVGPRPALPSEAAVFGDELNRRTSVLPGVTGLWQCEARDNPSFSAYERLDLFYVENWSVTLDLVILVSTVESELARMLRSGRRLVRARRQEIQALTNTG